MGTKIPSSPLNRRVHAVAWSSTSIAQWQRDRIAAAGGDPSIVPESPFRFLRLREVMQLTGLSRSAVYKLMEERRFPPNVPLSFRTAVAEGAR